MLVGWRAWVPVSGAWALAALAEFGRVDMCSVRPALRSLEVVEWWVWAVPPALPRVPCA